MKVGHNTFETEHDDGRRTIRLYDTDIVTFHPDGMVELDSGGWMTVTTKERMNRFSPFSVFAKRGTWYVRVGGIEGETVPFVDGIRLGVA